MKRIPYETVALQVEKLYDFSVIDDKEIDKQCLFIQEFIESCGWDIESYIRVMMGFDSITSN